jgi:uncharacterized membrane protein YdbT with pleckstrin-like domain
VPTIFDATSQKSTPAPTAAAPSPSGVKRVFPVTPSSEMGPLTCFMLNPQNVRFETQEPTETVILFLRQHPIVNVPWIIIAILLLLSPTILFPLFFTMLHLSSVLPPSYILIGTLTWYLATFGFILAKFIGWYFNIYIVTNERVVDIDIYYLLYKHFAEAELEKIQDISYESGGIIATIFDYGNVSIETAGEAPNLEFEKVPYPERVVETIRSLTEHTEQTL